MVNILSERLLSIWKCANNTSLSFAFQLIDICTAFSDVCPFPTYAWAPQCVLLTSSLACAHGILWQRQVLASDPCASLEWLDRSEQGIEDTLHIFRNCAIGNEQVERHSTVLQQIWAWLQHFNQQYLLLLTIVHLTKPPNENRETEFTVVSLGGGCPVAPVPPNVLVTIRIVGIRGRQRLFATPSFCSPILQQEASRLSPKSWIWTKASS